MPLPNPQPCLHMEGPLPLLSSICLLKSSPHHSQPSLAHTPEYLDSLLLLPMLQYPSEETPLLPTITSPLGGCPLDWSVAPSPLIPSTLTPTGPSSTGLLLPWRHTLTASNKSWPPNDKVTRRSWMTSVKLLNSWKPVPSGISTPSLNPLMATLKMVASPRLPSSA